MRLNLRWHIVSKLVTLSNGQLYFSYYCLTCSSCQNKEGNLYVPKCKFHDVDYILYIVVLGCGAIGTKSENNLWFRHDVKVLK